MLTLKQNGAISASIRDLKPEMCFVFVVASQIWGMMFDGQIDCVITSGTDGHQHLPKSLHNTGYGLDFRTNTLPDPRLEWSALIAAKLRLALGTNYDVVLESDHIHVEFDPK